MNNPAEQAIYRYDTSNNRYLRIDVSSAGERKVTYFISSTEIEYVPGQSVKYKRQLGTYAIVEEFNGTSTDRYLFTDHLGSVERITDSNGNLVQAMSFSAWGERRTPQMWETPLSYSSLQSMSDYTTRGFTGHEMVDAFGIINMGGRIYDAALGRMLQADPFVQDPTNTQSFNRYTYVFNNPLSYTDPSGYFSVDQIMGVAFGFVIGFVTAGLGWNVFWVGFSSGFTSAILITGNLKSAIKSGLISGALAFIGDKIFSKSKVDVAEGGKSAPGGMNDNVAAFSEPSSTPQSDPTVTAEVIEQASIGNAPSEIGNSLSTAAEVAVDKIALDPMVIYGEPISYQQLIAEISFSQLMQLDMDLTESFVEGWNGNGDLDQRTINKFRSSFSVILEARNYVANELMQRQFYQSAITTTFTIVSLATGAGEIVMLGRGIVKGLYSIGKKSVDKFLQGGKTFAQYKRAYWAKHNKPILQDIINPNTGQVWKQYAELHHRFIPQRWKVPNWLKNNRFNIQQLTSLEHAMVDKFRARFAPKWVKELFNLRWK